MSPTWKETATGHDGKPMSDAQHYKMLGNAVTVNVIEDIGNKLGVVAGLETGT